MAHREPRDIWIWAFGEKKRLLGWITDPRCLVNYATLYWRIVRAGWEPEKAITAAPHSSSKPILVIGEPS